ncbi:MAG TPA: hypothetical protein VF189_02930 [Patescibacteria group bacterium]
MAQEVNFPSPLPGSPTCGLMAIHHYDSSLKGFVVEYKCGRKRCHYNRKGDLPYTELVLVEGENGEPLNENVAEQIAVRPHENQKLGDSRRTCIDRKIMSN